MPAGTRSGLSEHETAREDQKKMQKPQQQNGAKAEAEVEEKAEAETEIETKTKAEPATRELA